MFDLNKLSAKELSYLFRETVSALNNKMPLLSTLTVTGHYGRWLFTSKNNYQQIDEANREYDVVGGGYNYLVSSQVTMSAIGNHRFERTVRTDNHYQIFILFNEEYDVLKAFKVFFHAHAHNLVPIQLKLTLNINDDGEVVIPGWYGDNEPWTNDYFHIDTVEDITDSLNDIN